MTERQLIAYTLMALLAVAVAAMVWWGRHNSAHRILARKRRSGASRATHAPWL